MADGHKVNHDYHIIDPSPWPLIGSIGALLMAVGGVGYMRWLHETDFTLGSLTTALREIIAAFPVYRTYVGEGTSGELVSPRDREYIARAGRPETAHALQRQPGRFRLLEQLGNAGTRKPHGRGEIFARMEGAIRKLAQ